MHLVQLFSLTTVPEFKSYPPVPNPLLSSSLPLVSPFRPLSLSGQQGDWEPGSLGCVKRGLTYRSPAAPALKQLPDCFKLRESSRATDAMAVLSLPLTAVFPLMLSQTELSWVLSTVTFVPLPASASGLGIF